MQVGVIGTGYVGLVTGVCLAELGHSVVAVDRDQSKVTQLTNGQVPIFEPGLEPLLRRALQAGHFQCTQRLSQMVDHADIVFLAVGTPSQSNGDIDLSHFKEAVMELGQALVISPRPGLVVVNKSTVPVGTQKWVADHLRSVTGQPVHVVSNPEFLKEGSAVQDFFKPDRIVLGAEEDEGFTLLEQLYHGVDAPVVRMDPVSAELTKYASNAFLAMRISFMNELSRVCERVGADIQSIQSGMALDSRIGKHFLNAGFGYGGSCFPKDVQGLAAQSRAAGAPMSIVEAVHEANQKQIQHLIAKTIQLLDGQVEGKVVALWGLAFKPNTDDVREAPALTLASHLIALGARVQAYDPEAMANAKLLVSGIKTCNSVEATLFQADVVVVATEWDVFQSVDLSWLRKHVSKVVDARAVFDVNLLKAHGFDFYSVGKSPARIGRSRSEAKSEHIAPDVPL